MTHRRAAFFLPVLLFLLAPAAWAQTIDGPAGSKVKGELVAEGDAFVVKSGSAHIALGQEQTGPYRASWEVKAEPGKAASVTVRGLPTDPFDYNKPNTMYVVSTRDATGTYVTVTPYRPDAEGKNAPYHAANIYYSGWAGTEEARKALDKVMAERGVPLSTHKDRWVPMRVELVDDRMSLWVEERLAESIKLPAGARGPIAIDAWAGERFRNFRVEPIASTGLMQPVNISAIANDRFGKPTGLEKAEVGGVPFELARGANDHINLRKAEWREWREDPADYYEASDSGPQVLNDPRTPFFRVPKCDYVAAHVLAYADDDEATTGNFTVRAGRSAYSEQVVHWDFPGAAPRRGGSGPALETPAGRLYAVRVPMTEAFAQDIGGDVIDVELNKEFRLARRAPDPCRFRYRALGLPSSVRVAAVTFEKSPIQMTVLTKESANIFVQPTAASFDLTLENITDREQAYSVKLAARHLHGETADAQKSGRLAPRQKLEVNVPLNVPLRGYYDLTATLANGGRQPLLVRRTTFAVLPPDTRQHRATAPWGTWDFGPTHWANLDADESASLQKKLGLRYSGFMKPELREKYGILSGAEPNIAGGDAAHVEVYEAALKRDPNVMKMAMLFHETSVSYEHILRVPDLFSDWPAYRFNEKEQATFDKLLAIATTAAKEMRAKYPDVKLTFGNGTLAFREAFYKAKFPRELFDYAGNEAGIFGRPPESQPPDVVAGNSSYWMDRQMLDHYGYAGVPIQHCYEACYVNTNPGNVGFRDQADYYVRHFLHGSAWGFPYMRYAMANDVGNSYYQSNWGASGLCHRWPEMNPKPAAVAVANMTLVLDGAKFAREVETGSGAVYALEFDRPHTGEKVWALWTTRGSRELTLDLGGAKATQIDDQGNEKALRSRGGSVAVTATPTPVFVIAKGALGGVSLGEPKHDERPIGKITKISDLSSLDGWAVDTQRDPYMEYYPLLHPRRKGDFAFEPVAEFAGQRGAIKVTPKPITHGKDTMPMYGAIAHERGIAVPGKPSEIGVWVNSAASFGRVIFELTDASGQTWTSIGAASADATPCWMETVVPDDMKSRFAPAKMSDWNTNDVFGWSYLNFDGWRYVGFPLPGQYPGEGYHWPGNSQWRWDKDGKVHYPLTFKRLIVELPEKVLKVKTFAPPKRKEIYVKDLVVVEDDLNAITHSGKE